MKNTIKWVLLFVVFTLLASLAFAPFYVAELDPDLQLLLEMFVGFLMTGLFKLLSGWIKVDLSGWVAIAAAFLSAFFVTLINALLSGIPLGYESLAVYVMKILAILLGSMGFYSVKKHTARSITAFRDHGIG